MRASAQKHLCNEGGNGAVKKESEALAERQDQIAKLINQHFMVFGAQIGIFRMAETELPGGAVHIDEALNGGEYDLAARNGALYLFQLIARIA